MVTKLPIIVDEIDSILLDLKTGSFMISEHAIERMIARNVFVGDIQALGWSCTSYRRQRRNRWLINGRDLDGDDLSVVVEYTSQSLIVTVMESRE